MVEGSGMLVTGASGFIGRALSLELLAEGCRVRALLHQDATDMHPQLECIRGSLDDRASLLAACEDVDCVFHLAAYTHVNHGSREALLRINVDGTARLLEAAIASKVRRIVYFSSCLADDSREGGQTAYGESKREAEKLLLAAQKQGLIEVCCLRPVNVYGPGMKGNLMSMIRLIRRGIFPPLPESANRLSLVGVSDLCQAAILAAEASVADGRVYDVTDGRSYSMREIERSIRQAMGKPLPRWSVPHWILFVAAVKLEILARVVRLRNAPGLRSYRALTSHKLYSNEKISHDLGYNPRATFPATLPLILQGMDA